MNKFIGKWASTIRNMNSWSNCSDGGRTSPKPEFSELCGQNIVPTKIQNRCFPVFRLMVPEVLQGPGEGAGVVDIGDGYAVVFKVESHNHPSAIEPYQGAATGVGGILRDIFSMGARPIAVLNSLRFGPLTCGKSTSKKSNVSRSRYLFGNVVAGIAGYGNCIGVPTVGGEVCFDECYSGNPLVNAMGVGILRHDQLQHGRAEGIGKSVIYVGAATGRDGIHGATFASEKLNEDSDAKRPAVQVGDPFMGKLLIEACLEVTKAARFTAYRIWARRD